MKRYLKNFSLAIPFLFVGIAALVACDFTQESFNIHQALSNLMNDLHLGLIPLVLLGCTRAIYVANEETKSIFTVRSMDWSDPNIPTSLWASPRGSDRTGAGESDEGYPYTWKSQYKSLVVCNYNKSATDGINEKGLVANLLFLPQANYTHDEKSKEKLRLTITALAQYVLDNYATVKEVVEGLKQQPFFIVTSKLAVAKLDPETNEFQVYFKPIVLHLSVSDSQGDSAVFQYVEDDQSGNSKLLVYYVPEEEKVKGKETITVLTNNLYAKQLELLNKFKEDNGDFNWGVKSEVFSWDELKKYSLEGEVVKEAKEMNPPMNGADIRFLRASFYSNMLDKIDEHTKNKRPFIDETQRDPKDLEGSHSTWVEDWSEHEGLARAVSLIRNMSTPLNVQAIDDNPFLAATVWRTVADHGNKRYFFELNRALYPLYVDLEELFADLETVKKLDLYVPPVKQGEKGIDLLEDQLNKGEKIGKVNHLFEDVKDNKWFYFDYQRSDTETSGSLH
ncbi:linear amide C-N hydrolase [Nostoc sp. MG11]|uniref:linear amide C-N hydrolase n=1 Tax=Nostoc sp. MG11 TaxID=2721166 RepID=UPI001866D409|nr:linear amide C-N hydrolase [Nostoc sp. MG11]